MSVKTLITQEPRYLCEPTHSNLVQMQSSASYFFLVIIFHVVFVWFGRNSLEAYFNHLRRKVTQNCVGNISDCALIGVKFASNPNDVRPKLNISERKNQSEAVFKFFLSVAKFLKKRSKMFFLRSDFVRQVPRLVAKWRKRSIKWSDHLNLKRTVCSLLAGYQKTHVVISPGFSKLSIKLI